MSPESGVPAESDPPAEPAGPARSAGATASKGVLGRGSIYTLGTVAPILANVAVVPIVTRLLGTQAYGVVAIAITVMWVAMMAGSFGMPSVITRQGILARSGVAGARALLLRGSLMTVGFIAAVLLTAPLWAPLVLVLSLIHISEPTRRTP